MQVRMSIPLAVVGAAMGLVSLGCEAPPVGDPCLPEVVPEGGFQRSEVYLENPSLQCRSRICIVNHYQGDLIDSAVNGDGIPERDADEDIDGEDTAPCGESCGWVGIEDRIYCTCKCGVTAGGDSQTITCDACPGGFECCPIFSIGGEGFKGDYCVRDGTCERAGG
jgi:hypothetical protein